MWCRLITNETGSAAQPISWRQVGASEGSPSASDIVPLYTDRHAEEQSGSGRSEELAADAYERGLRDGEDAAAEKITEQVTAKLQQLARSIEQLALHRGKIQREAEPELVRLALAIARRIMRRELTIDPDALLGLLKAGLEKIEASEMHRVRVHPEHAATLTRLLDGAARPVAVVADPSLPVGAVVFETSRGSLDTGLDTQLREIERGFADIFPK
jgi:flagellar assembly protein FliH